jgi:VIT1/CCC1 family predicted Fe2+/Mn2+ transporter
MSAVPNPRLQRDEELESAFLYRVLAGGEKEARVREMFAGLAQAAEQQAEIWADLERVQLGREPASFAPSLSTRWVATLVRRLGGKALRPILAAKKVRGLSVWSTPLVSEHAMPTRVEHVGARHRGAHDGSNLRAAVFGISDGLVSNASLILGVSGATSDNSALLITGLAGLLAGASSMAAGEYVSVRSQRELYEYQIGLERAELAEYPEEEAAELALIYQARGLDKEQAVRLAQTMMADPKIALDTLAREELGLDPDSLGSPWSAASYSFMAFAIGAALPLAPLVFARPERAVMFSASTAFCALFTTGASLSLFTGRSALWSGLRLALIGSAAAGATYGIGRLFGVALG